MKLGLLTAAFPDTPLDRRRRLGGRQRVRDARGGLLATSRRAVAPLRRRVAHRLRRARPTPRPRSSSTSSPSGASRSPALGYYPNPLSPDREHRAEVLAHLRT